MDDKDDTGVLSMAAIFGSGRGDMTASVSDMAENRMSWDTGAALCFSIDIYAFSALSSKRVESIKKRNTEEDDYRTRTNSR